MRPVGSPRLLASCCFVCGVVTSVNPFRGQATAQQQDARPPNHSVSVLQLALFLVAERAKGADSEWAGYLASLPDQPESPLFWTPRQLELLDGTQLLQSIEGYRCITAVRSRLRARSTIRHPSMLLTSHPAQLPAAAIRLHELHSGPSA